ncbi:MAG: hypothetical protein WBN07_05660 [Woeseiaceae bacterium]
MNNLYTLLNHPAWDGDNPGDFAYTGQDADGRHLYLSGGNLEAEDRLPVDALQVVQHDQDTGEPLTDPSTYAALLPTGNVYGYAPSYPPQFLGWQGRALRLAQPSATAVGDPLLPADAQADSVIIRRKYFDDAWAGWGFRVELMYGSDATNKAIARYLDADYTNYHYTTGAFSQGPSDWQTDESGDPVTVYFTETPAGFRTAEKEDEYLGLWFGQLVAKSPLLLGVDERLAYYFPEGGGGGTWIDSGETYQGLGGANYILVSGTTPFSVNQKIRLAEVVYTISQIFAGAGLVIDGTPSGVATGTSIEILQ